jgi:2-methylcitrate dehydratase PrpD
VLTDSPDQNAIVPQRVVVRLKDGAEHAITIRAIYGHPDAALTETENLDKFTRNCSYARSPVAPELQDQLIAFIANWETVDDVARLPRLLATRVVSS